MININFDLGFKVNRNLLTLMLTSKFKENNNIIVPDVIGNKMDVKVKCRVSRKELEQRPVIKITNPTHCKPKVEEVLYKECLHIIQPDMKKLENKLKDKFVSISIFQNGKALLSVMDASIQKLYYKWFIDINDKIEEDVKQLVVPKKDISHWEKPSKDDHERMNEICVIISLSLGERT